MVFYVKANTYFVFVFKSQDILCSKAEFLIGSQITYRLKSDLNSQTRLSGIFLTKNDLPICTCTNIQT